MPTRPDYRKPPPTDCDGGLYRRGIPLERWPSERRRLELARQNGTAIEGWDNAVRAIEDAGQGDE